MYEKAIVFGVFQGFHQGHQYFLNEAAKKSKQLIVVVTLSEVVKRLKNYEPNSFETRVEAIRSFNPNLTIVPGDLELGAWTVLKTHTPNIVFLGYDQKAIANELTKMNIPFEYIDSHHPEKYKSSLL